MPLQENERPARPITRYLIALLACGAVVVTYVFILAAMNMKHGGVLGMIILFGVVGSVWRSTMRAGEEAPAPASVTDNGPLIPVAEFAGPPSAPRQTASIAPVPEPEPRAAERYAVQHRFKAAAWIAGMLILGSLIVPPYVEARSGGGVHLHDFRGYHFWWSPPERDSAWSSVQIDVVRLVLQSFACVLVAGLAASAPIGGIIKLIRSRAFIGTTLVACVAAAGGLGYALKVDKSKDSAIASLSRERDEYVQQVSKLLVEREILEIEIEGWQTAVVPPLPKGAVPIKAPASKFKFEPLDQTQPQPASRFPGTLVD